MGTSEGDHLSSEVCTRIAVSSPNDPSSVRGTSVTLSSQGPQSRSHLRSIDSEHHVIGLDLSNLDLPFHLSAVVGNDNRNRHDAGFRRAR